MTTRDYKKILPHVALISGGFLLLLGLFILGKSEEKKTRDTEAMQEVIGIKQDLQRYYLSHASYPQEFAVPEKYEYISLGDNDAPCTLSLPASCFSYELRFSLETNLFAQKGAHTLTPEGIQ